MEAVGSHNPGLNIVVLGNTRGEEDVVEGDEADPVADLVAAEVESMIAASSENT